MDRLEQYRNLIKQQIHRYVDSFSDEVNSGVQEIAVFDDEHGQFQWVSLGWENGKRSFYTHLYVRLHNGKIWIEKDTTEDGIATELVQAGVPREDIVLAFHSPELRHLTEFAAA